MSTRLAGTQGWRELEKGQLHLWDGGKEQIKITSVGPYSEDQGGDNCVGSFQPLRGGRRDWGKFVGYWTKGMVQNRRY